MIDFGFSKLMVVGVVTLVVIGPEKLPRVARMAGTLFGRAQRYISEVKAEVRCAVDIDEMRKMQQDVKDAVVDAKNSRPPQLEAVQASDDPAPVWRGRALQAATSDNKSAHGQLACKAKDFRRKKLARSSTVPVWYKQQSMHQRYVISTSARIAKYGQGGLHMRSSTISIIDD
ncbi:MAG: Sec-independent protein translocase protein TatB [Pseudomonadota bacterium]